MSFYISGNVVDQNNAPVIGADIYVYSEGVLATLVDANDVPVANPIGSGEDGFYSLYTTDNGPFDLRFFWAGKERLIRTVPRTTLFTPEELDQAVTITGTNVTLTNASRDAAAASAADALGYATNLATAQRFSYSIVGHGQSLMMAFAPLVTTSVSHKLLILNGGEEVDAFTTSTNNDSHMQNVGANMGSLVPFFPSNSENGEGWAQGLDSVLSRDSLCDAIAYTCTADGGRHARELIYNSGRYSNFYNAAQRQHKLLTGYVKPVIIWTQGEADADTAPPGGGGSESPVSRSQYFNILKDWRDYIRRDLAPIYERNLASLPAYITPLSSTTLGQGALNIQASYIDAINDGGFIVFPPHYQFYQEHDSTAVHLKGQGRRYYAEIAGSVIERVERYGLPYQAMHVKSTSIVDGTIKLIFHTPDNSDIVIDTTTFADPALNAGELFGVRFYDASASAYAGISSITASGKTLTITTNSPPASGDRIEIAQQPWPGSPTAPVSNSARSNIRCGLSHTAADSTILYHYALPQRVTL